MATHYAKFTEIKEATKHGKTQMLPPF